MTNNLRWSTAKKKDQAIADNGFYRGFRRSMRYLSSEEQLAYDQRQARQRHILKQMCGPNPRSEGAKIRAAQGSNAARRKTSITLPRLSILEERS